MAVLKYWDETLSQWLPVAPGPKGDKGDKGDTGDLANLDIGTVTTGSLAAAHINGNFEDGYELDLTLPSVGAGSIHDADVNAAADIGRSKIAGTALTAESMGIFNVKDYGAVGDGTTDDTVAVEAAIAAAGVGGVVYFPQGAYQVSRTLWPMHGQIWRGVHSPKYKNTDDPDSTCYIFPGAVFTGRALIERAASVNGVAIDQLCLLGKGDEDPVSLDGVHLGDMSYERTWIVKNCTIHGFSNSGVTGRLHVFDMRDCHVARNGYGLRVTGGNALTDVRIFGCQFYFNLHGGLCLDVTTRSNGMVSVHGCRFERSGSTPGDPSVNRDPAAPGIRIQKGYNIDLVQCSTDANSGPGLEILGDPAGGMYTFGITVTDCKFARDGGGDQSLGTQLPGVKIKGASSIYFTSNVTWGEADDDGGGSGLISPYYSVWLEDTAGCKILRSGIVAPNPLNSVKQVGSNSGLSVDGATPYMDLLGTDTQNKEIRFRIDDGLGNTYTRWATGVNPTASGGTWSVQRYDGTGAYIDSPININWATGLVETGRIYAKAQAVGQVPLEVRSSDTSPTNSYFVAAKSDGTKVFEVQWNGRVRSNWGSNAFAIQQQGSTQVVLEGASGGNTLLACYTSVANADADSPVFEVRPNGVQIPAASNGTDAVQRDQVASLVTSTPIGYDSGARDLISVVTANGTATYTNVQLRRVGPVVYLSLKLANTSVSTTHELLASLPVGFRPNVDESLSIYPPGAASSSQNTVVSVASTNGKIQYRNNNAAVMSGTISWLTNDGTPSTLPGAPL